MMSSSPNNLSRTALAIVLLLAVASAGCLICVPAGDSEGFPFFGDPGAVVQAGLFGPFACVDPVQYLFLVLMGFAPETGDVYTPPAFLKPERVGQATPGGGYLAMTLGPAGELVSSVRTTSNVRAFDVAQAPLGAAEARLPGAGAPLRRVFLSDAAGQSVIVIHPETRQIVATIQVGRAPHGMAFSPDGARLYVANRDAASISVVDAAALAVTGSLSLPGGGSPVGLAVTPDGGKLFAVNGVDAGAVVVFDLVGGGPAQSIRVGRRPTRIRLTPDGSTAFVANSGANSVSVLDTRSNTLTAALTVDRPSDLAVSADGNFVYALSAGVRGRVLEFSVATLRETRSWDVGDTPLSLTLLPGGTALLATNSNSTFLSLIDLVAGRDVLSVPAPLGLGSAAVLLVEDRPPLSAGM